MCSTTSWMKSKPSNPTSVTSFDVWVPYMEQTVLNGVKEWMLRDRHDRNMLGIARLKPGVTFEQARIARQAYSQYGKGNGHPAHLNFGDCFTYALARVKREPVLFKGDEFAHTDLRSAI